MNRRSEVGPGNRGVSISYNRKIIRFVDVLDGRCANVMQDLEVGMQVIY
jgi:hypothetical protein